MSIGMVLGRDTQADSEANERSKEAAKLLHDKFLKQFHHTNCEDLIRGISYPSPEHKAHCKRFVGEMAAQACQIISNFKE